MVTRSFTIVAAVIVAVIVIGSNFAPASCQAGQCVSAPSSLAHWWPADGNAFDVVGGENGVLQGDTVFGTGEVGQAFNLDGSGDFVLVENDPAAAFNFNGSFSVDAWIFLRSYSPEFAPVVSKWNDLGVDERSYFLAIIDDGKLRFDVSTNGLFLGAGNSSQVFSSATIPLNTWTHVAGVFDAAAQTLTVYVNGAPDGSQAAPFSTVFVNDEPVLIGAGDLGSNVRDFTDGLIDEVELFGRALTAAEIASIHGAGSAGKVLPIQIDIKPGGVPNPINLGSQGNVPVAILTTETFDASTVDVSSIRFAGAPVAERNNDTTKATLEDVDGDGDLDLMLHFDTQMLVLTSTSIEATLTAITSSGRCVSGTDSIKIVPPKKIPSLRRTPRTQSKRLDFSIIELLRTRKPLDSQF
jgi:hypothetical protein